MPGGFRGVEGPRGPTKTTCSDEINEDFLVHAALYTHGGYIVDWKVIAGKGGYWIESLAPRPIWQFMSMISYLQEEQMRKEHEDDPPKYNFGE